MSRIDILAQWLEDEHHAALITSDISRRYLCGFASSAGVILVTKECSYLLIDFRYIYKAMAAVDNCEVLLLKNMKVQLLDLLMKHGIDKLSVEAASMTVSELGEYTEMLHYVTIDSSNALSDKLSAMRIIKSADEIEKIEKAQRIAEKAYERLLGTIRKGITEKQTAALLNYYIMDCGAEDISFATIAASGVNSASPHAVPTDKPIAEGEFLTLDFGAVYDGYHSDMTRTIAVGKITNKMEEVYSAVQCANLDGLKTVRAGLGAKVVDSVARSTLNALGRLDEYFGHGLGHGVGLEIHEPPSLSQSSKGLLREGMVVTIEPGVYISGQYGVRIEDMVVVTENGCKNLTNTTKSLIHV